MDHSYLLSVVTFVYGLAGVLYIVYWIFKMPAMAKPAFWTLLAAVIGNTVGIIWRWIASYQMGIGHAPFSNMYESLIFFSWTIGAIYVYIETRYKNPVIGAFVAPLAFLALAYASLSPGISARITPLVPVLKSNWLIAHVVTCFLAYAAFAIAFGISVIFLLKHQGEQKETGMLVFLPDKSVLDELNYKMIMFGFLFLTIGIITGAVWANSAWGRYWGWDSKETWSLITWFVYAVGLHFRIISGRHGMWFAGFSMIGFGAVLFTYFGVNYLLAGLHSYGR